jgi:hypothetical protein
VLLHRYIHAHRLAPIDSSGYRAAPTSVTAAATRSVNNLAVQPGRPGRAYHALVGGALGGFVVWGRYSAISHQVLLYLGIRVLVALWKQLPLHDNTQWRTTYRLASSLVWALVMYLWENSPDDLHPSLRKSMDEIYATPVSEESWGTALTA